MGVIIINMKDKDWKRIYDKLQRTCSYNAERARALANENAKLQKQVKELEEAIKHETQERCNRIGRGPAY